MKNKGVLIFWIVLAVLIVGGFGASIYMKTLPGKYDGLAQCLKDKGVVFYGAFWCPHCQATKKQFGNSAEKLPYHECSNPDKSQNAECNALGIQSYPTWVRPGDDQRLTGEHTLQEIAEFGGCTLPQ